MSGTSYGALLDAVRGVQWPARRVVPAGPVGTHHSHMRGASTEFAEYRAYRQGDDPRRIDWRLLARADRAYIRLTTDRAVLGTTIVLDSSASMAFSPSSHAKWRLAEELAIGLAAVAHAAGDPVGLVVADAKGEPRTVAPRTRRGVVDELARVITDLEPLGSPPLAPLARAARSARIVVVSDMLGDADELTRVVSARVAAGGEMHVVHVVAREEIEPPNRTLLAADPEDPSIERLLTEATRRGYDEAFGEWRTEIARQVRGGGASYTLVVTDEPAPHAVRRIARPPGKVR
jgi:uncharacterized protein (DUF58 family)